MSGWTKLFGSITESSIWVEDDKTLRVWVAMLARCNSDGIVSGSIPGFASLCRMSVDEFRARLDILKSPDPYSRNPDNEGKRIEDAPGGWKVLNRNKYRDIGQDLQGSRARYFREYRKKKHINNVAQRCAQQINVACNTETETETEKDKERIYKKEKLRYGQFENVLLTTPEKEKVSIEEIEAISEYLASHGKKYKSHYATILTWRRKNKSSQPNPYPLKKDTTFIPCPKCGKETTKEDIRNLNSCPACFKPIPKEKLKEILSEIGRNIK